MIFELLVIQEVLFQSGDSYTCSLKQGSTRTVSVRSWPYMFGANYLLYESRNNGRNDSSDFLDGSHFPYLRISDPAKSKFRLQKHQPYNDI